MTSAANEDDREWEDQAPPNFKCHSNASNIVDFKALKAHQFWAEKCCFSPKSYLLATCSGDMSVRLWKVADDNFIAEGTLLHFATVWCCDFNASETHLCTCCSDGGLYIWNLSTKKCEQTFHGNLGSLFSCKFSPDGRLVAAAGIEKLIKLWDPELEMCRVLRGHRNVVDDIAFAPCGKVLASVSKDRTCRLWFLAGKYVKSKILRGHRHWITSCEFSSSGHLLATTSMDGTVRLWDVAGMNFKLLHVLSGHTCIVWSSSFFRVGGNDVLVSCASDRSLRFWSVEAGKQMHCEREIGAEQLNDNRGNQLLSCAASHDSKYVALCDYEGRLFLGNLEATWRIFFGSGTDGNIQSDRHQNDINASASDGKAEILDGKISANDKPTDPEGNGAEDFEMEHDGKSKLTGRSDAGMGNCGGKTSDKKQNGTDETEKDFKTRECEQDCTEDTEMEHDGNGVVHELLCPGDVVMEIDGKISDERGNEDAESVKGGNNFKELNCTADMETETSGKTIASDNNVEDVQTGHVDIEMEKDGNSNDDVEQNGRDDFQMERGRIAKMDSQYSAELMETEM